MTGFQLKIITDYIPCILFQIIPLI